MNTETRGPEEGSTFLKSAAAVIGKLLAAAGILLALLVALFIFNHQRNFAAKDLPLGSAGEYTRLEPGDKVLHAYTGVRWQDSQRYFVIQADPSGFERRIAEAGGEVVSGSGKDLCYSSEKLPEWWDVGGLENLVSVDVGSSGSPHNGERRFYSKDRGLIYVIDR